MIFLASYDSDGITGWVAVFAFILILYLFVYIPIKILVKVFAHAKAKADRFQKLQSNVVIAEYDPPAKLTPSEIGFLYDTKLGLEEIYGTIVSLEQKGLVKFEEANNTLSVKEVKNAPKDLNKFEKYILNSLKESSEDDNKIYIGSATIEGVPNLLARKNKSKIINKGFLKRIRWEADTLIREELQSKGFIKTFSEQLKSVFVRVLFITVLLLILPIISLHPYTLDSIAGTLLFILFFGPFFFFAAFFLYVAYSKIVGQPYIGTEKLNNIWPEVEGYKQFIEAVELDRLKFESENTKGMVKNKVLPYAIALGFNTGWKNKV